MLDSHRWTIEARPWDDPAGSELRRLQRVELDARYGTDDHEPGPLPSAADVDVFLVAVDSGTAEAIACGALRQLSATSAEVKRMYVVPRMRGTGLATGLLRALEAAAIERRWYTLRLETGTEQPDAIRFYQRSGYRQIPLYGNYIGSAISLCFERDLR
nr:GNAT family N-acetyltransferase [Kibdelosporangium sp. MJ126-NF4]CEL18958.1 Histone acetyltransferase HPA2 and related acetyltransferases [Kibdelosporangium sp. MJ126-NF4]CTQ95239.1 Histone acetyltransferase HPA2 and related acetyltransferases [Kibdelosporangium sp. MJ126-NF4]